MTHRFLADGSISCEDVGRLIKLTEAGSLSWRPSKESYALNAYPAAVGAADDPLVSAEAVGENLRGIRMGYNPQTRHWHYLRLTAHGGSRCYIEEGSPAELMELGNQLFALACKAERLGGTLRSGREELHFCETCGRKTPHKHLIDSPHGLEGAYMAGSERLTCTVCETSVMVNTLQEA